MELTAERDQYFPTSTPVLDAHRPFSGQRLAGDKLSTGNSVFISSAVIMAFTALPVLRSVLDAFSAHPVLIWTAFVLLPLLAFAAGVAMHEVGHLLVARAIGFETVQFKLGPLSHKANCIKHGLWVEQVFAIGGVVLRPKGGEGLRRKLFYLVVSGSFTNLLFSLLLEAGVSLVPAPVSASWILVRFASHLFSAFSGLVGIAALIPDLNSNGQFSDGARLIMLAKDDVLAARWLAIAKLQMAINAGVEARDWDEDLVMQALAEKDDSLDSAMGSWLAYLWALGQQEITLATKHLEDTLAAMAASSSHMRDRIYMEAAIFQSWFRHNAGKGRFWASQIRGAQSLPQLQKLHLDIALRWAEGQPFAAWEMLGQYLLLLRQMPASPQREIAEKNALEWKTQMESRMLAGAWATMHSWSQQLETDPTASFKTASFKASAGSW
jgi:hypothetical protein